MNNIMDFSDCLPESHLDLLDKEGINEATESYSDENTNVSTIDYAMHNNTIKKVSRPHYII
jgi:hypothetical protein